MVPCDVSKAAIEKPGVGRSDSHSCAAPPVERPDGRAAAEPQRNRRELERERIASFALEETCNLVRETVGKHHIEEYTAIFAKFVIIRLKVCC